MPYLYCMATATTTKESITMGIDFNIKLAETHLRLIQAHGRDKFLPGTYDGLVANLEERIVALISKREEVAA